MVTFVYFCLIIQILTQNVFFYTIYLNAFKIMMTRYLSSVFTEYALNA